MRILWLWWTPRKWHKKSAVQAETSPGMKTSFAPAELELINWFHPIHELCFKQFDVFPWTLENSFEGKFKRPQFGIIGVRVHTWPAPLEQSNSDAFRRKYYMDIIVSY